MSSFRDQVQANIPRPISMAEEARRVMTKDAQIVADAIRRDILERAKYHRSTASKFRYERMLLAGPGGSDHCSVCTYTTQFSKISHLIRSNEMLMVKTWTRNPSNADLFLSALRGALQTDGIRVGSWGALFYQCFDDYTSHMVHGVSFVKAPSDYQTDRNVYTILNPADSEIHLRHGPYSSDQPMQFRRFECDHKVKKCELYLGNRLLEKHEGRISDLSCASCLQIQYE